jgi:hypothetical protein
MTWTHAVVGCPECTALWIITPDPETVTCPRCRTHHPRSNLRKLATTTSKTQARELRGRLLAQQHNADPTAIDDTSYFSLEGELEPSDTTTQTAAEHTLNLAKPELLKHTIQTLEDPTTDSIHHAMTTHGVDEEETTTLLEKLRHNGSIIKEHDQYRVI